MKFIVAKTGLSFFKDCPPCEEAKIEEFIGFTDCTCETLDEAIKHDWVQKGNPVQKEGFVRVYKKEKKEYWTIEIKNLEELIKFKNTYGSLVLLDSDTEEAKHELEIYSGYRE